MKTRGPSLVLAVLAVINGGCLDFSDGGRYACNEQTRADCSSSVGGGFKDGGSTSVGPGGLEEGPSSGGEMGDGGETPLPMGSDGGTDPLTVTGRRYSIRILGTNETSEPQSLAGRQIVAYVPTDGGFQTISGVGSSAGTFFVPNVPLGASYWLRVGGEYIWSSLRDFDLTNLRVGRAGRGLTTRAGTGVNFTNVDNLSAWKDTDYLLFASLGAGISKFDPGPAPAAGAQSLTLNVPFNIDEGLVYSAAGDRVDLCQLVTDNADGGYRYAGLRRCFRPAPFSMNDGQTVGLNGSFAELPVTLSSRFDFRRSEFGAQGSISVPPPGPEGGVYTYFSVFAFPAGNMPHGNYDNSPILSRYESPEGTGDLLMTMRYSNPFTETELTGVGEVYFRTTYALPGTSALTEYASIRTHENLAAATAGPMTLKVGPVREPRINGASLFVKSSGATTTPTLTWLTPSIGAATLYTIHVYELFNDAGRTRSSFIARLFTSDRQITIPPGILDPGSTYYLRIIAEYDASKSTRRPFWSSNPRHLAEVLTATFEP